MATSPVPSSRIPLGQAFGVAFVILVAVVAATYFATTADDDTELDVTGPDVTAAEPVDDGTGDEPGDTSDSSGTGDTDVEGRDDAEPAVEPPIAVERPANSDFEGAMGDGEFFGGEAAIVHGDAGFATLHWRDEAFVARRSADGLAWTDTETSGLPERAWPRSLVATDAEYVAVFEQYREYDVTEGDEHLRFGPEDQPVYLLARSDDMVAWTTTELPVVEPVSESEYGTSVYLAGVTVAGDALVAIHNQFPYQPSDWQLLFEAGVLDEDNFDSYCGMSWESFERNEPVVLYSCDFTSEEARMAELEERMAAAESDEEQEAIEREFDEVFAEPDRTEIGTVEPGTELYEALRKAMTGEFRPRLPSIVLAGPLDGPFVTATLDLPGDPHGVVASDDGFAALLTEFAQDVEPDRFVAVSSIITSADGLEWSDPVTVADAGLWQMVASGPLVVASGDAEGDPVTYVSTDSGRTWSLRPFGAELYGAWTTALAGPAGVAVWVEGSTEPFPEYPPLVLRAEKDGYRLELVFEEDLLLLTGPDGEVVHELNNLDEVLGDRDVPGVLREDTGDVVTFLDPETGDDLISFTEEDLERAYADNAEAVNELYDEPPRATELWFTGDGVEWRRLEVPVVEASETENPYAQLTAVGDDEVLVTVTRWLTPPPELYAFEEEGREPTDAEIAALDEWFAGNGGGSEVEWFRIPIG